MLWSAPSLVIQDELGEVFLIEGALRDLTISK